MKRNPPQLCVLLILLTLAQAPAPAQSNPATYHNPVIAGDYPDPSVIRVGNEYWATATTSEWAPLFPLLRSRDLVNWTHVGNVFQKRPEWSVGNYWAPEIQAFNGQYYIYYVGRKKGGPLSLAVATAPRPEGPYTDHGPMIGQEAGSIDAVTMVDENGERYLIWKEDGNSRQRPTPIWAQKLSPDGLKLIGEMKELIRNDQPWEGNLVEGPFLLRRGDWFYMFYSGNACCGRGCNYGLGVARAKKLLGPWEKYPRNPLLVGNEIWKCPGHGSIVTDERGRDYLLYHAYHAQDFVDVGRQALLDEVEWNAEGWPSINQGKGPSIRALSPAQAFTRNPEHYFHDEFEKQDLHPAWQWPQHNEPIARINSTAGQLHLSPRPERAKDLHGAALAVKTTVGDYVAMTLVDVHQLPPGGFAGLSAFGDMENALGISAGAHELVLWRRQKGKTENVASAPVNAAAGMHLKMSAAQGHLFRFSYSVNGRDWIALGGEMDLDGAYLPPWDRGVRVALTAGGIENVNARFDWLHLVPLTR
jgi:xylan 1,4-beta-xylosidase